MNLRKKEVAVDTRPLIKRAIIMTTALCALCIISLLRAYREQYGLTALSAMIPTLILLAIIAISALIYAARRWFKDRRTPT